MAEETNAFQARPYQIDLYEQAINENVIIYLPTGSGKTFVAVMLIRKLSGDLLKEHGEAKKHSVFIVNTVPLVIQQSEYISRITGLNCGAYSGEMNVDAWNENEWNIQFQKNQVLVMTAQIFLDLLCHGYITLKKVNLIIFDECHRGVNDHPMRVIMKRFVDCPPNEQPRILGLTATLLNSNVKPQQAADIVSTLEVTFQSKIATVNHANEIEGYYAKPTETIEKFKPYTVPAVGQKIDEIVKDMQVVLELVDITEDSAINNKYTAFQPKSANSKLKNQIDSLQILLEDTGVYGGSKTALHILIELERVKKLSNNIKATYVIEYLITQMTNIRKLLENEMHGYTETERIYRFSSEKVKKLCQVIKESYEHSSKNSKFCCIVFVQRKLTAKILYHVLKNLNMYDEDYKFLLAEFMIGFHNNPTSFGTENMCFNKWNKEVLTRFRNGQINCVVATNLLDEGIDIPDCALIVRYDLPKDFREYVQSKGRARHKYSQYTLLLSEQNLDYILNYKAFKETEERLKLLLIGKTRLGPDENEVQNELYQNNIDPYYVIGNDGVKRVITEQAAVGMVNWYCCSLFRSKFINLTPTWMLYKESDDEIGIPVKYKVSIKLPITSPLRGTIFGDPMPSVSTAKRSAAMRVCKLLHEMGELTSYLTPRIKDFNEGNDHLFPHWENESQPDAELIGTYKKKRQYELQFPSAFYEALPRPNKKLYLHILYAEPAYSPMHDHRSVVFHSLLSSKACYGILSAKPMPQIPSFPIFMNVGELNVNVKVNYTTMMLSQEDIEYARIFHSTVFSQIVEIIKTFMVFDFHNCENSFLIVPVNENWGIDWDVIKKYQHINYITQDAATPFKNCDYELALVVPSYRGSSSVYVVTQVYDDLTPQSSFPTEDFYSYASYYKEKHGLIITDLRQPMLGVKPISKKIRCIKPWNMKPGLSKRKRADLLDDFEEELVPELCHRIQFPALYWLKATTLPSILHRISQLVTAEDLRVMIINETGLGNLKPSEQWPPLKFAFNDEDEAPQPSAEVPFDEAVENSYPELDLSGPEVDVLNIDTNVYPWTKTQEPTDLYRNMEQIQGIDIEYFHQFMTTELNPDTKSMGDKKISFMKRPNVVVPDLIELNCKTSDGPDPVQIMHALTTKMGNDAFNLERLETLGDSYLKFIVTLFLYSTFPNYTEGVLTALKGKIIGNRNLFYCGRNKQIPGRMKVEDFIPMSNFLAPAYTVYRPLQKALLEAQVPPNVLYEINIPVEERLSGSITPATTQMIKDIVSKWDSAESQTGMEHYLGIQIVPDKAVADCVEALIGVYLKSMGMEGAGRLLKWFEILPSTLDIEKLLHSPPENPSLSEGNARLHMPWASSLEDRIGYKFKNPAFLLQAFTHSSYSANTLTNSYEKLEFLGDAILDFLLTCHIFDTCGELSPGELTDLRSALVNNVTFACICVRYGLHTALLSYAPILNDAIHRFVKFMEEADYAMDTELIYILAEEEDCSMAEHVDVPKTLGDLFESLIGAIYLDSNKDLKCVWQIIYSLMHKEIDGFSKNVPKQAIRLLYETQGAQPTFSDVTVIKEKETVMITLRVNVAGKYKFFHGFGANKKHAKCAAAKQALKYIKYKN